LRLAGRLSVSVAMPSSTLTVISSVADGGGVAAGT
jgi:hypothetical protein